MLPAVIVASSLAAAPPVQLATLARLYQTYDLPLPPKDAKFIRYAPSGGNFLAPPPRIGFDVTERMGRNSFRSQEPVFIFPRGLFGCETDPISQTFVTAIESDLKQVSPVEVSLPTAIQCYHRGWRELALEVYSRGGNWQDRPSERVLAWAAYGYWRQQLHDPKVDRAKVARRLAVVRQTEPMAFTDNARQFYDHLLLSLKPSGATAGTVEADLDDLLDVSEVFSGGWCGDHRYTAIVGRGFDAVPALIDHLSDNRLTRSQEYHFQPSWMWTRDYRVKHFASDILVGLLHDNDAKTDAEGMVRAKDARAWWAKAQKVGEEKFAVARVLEAKGDASRPNPYLLWVLERKYPERLPEVFRTLLAKRSEMSLDELASAVADSSLTADTKRKLFREAVESKNAEWQKVGKESLKVLDVAK